MKLVFGHRNFSLTLVAGLVLSLGVLTFAQNQTTSTSQSKSQNGSSSASASASSQAKSSGSSSAGQSASGSVSGAPLKGTMYVVLWTANLTARVGPEAIAQHKDFLNTYGKEYGLLMEGVIGGEEPGRMALMQGNPQKVREFAANSPLVINRYASFEIKPYSVEYSRVGLVADKGDLPAATGVKDGESSSSQQSTQNSQTSQTTQSSGGKSGG